MSSDVNQYVEGVGSACGFMQDAVFSAFLYVAGEYVRYEGYGA